MSFLVQFWNRRYEFLEKSSIWGLLQPSWSSWRILLRTVGRCPCTQYSIGGYGGREQNPLVDNTFPITPQLFFTNHISGSAISATNTFHTSTAPTRPSAKDASQAVSQMERPGWWKKIVDRTGSNMLVWAEEPKMNSMYPGLFLGDL